MNEVKFQNEKTLADRWGLKKYFYQQQGRRESLNLRLLGGIFGFMALITAGYSIFSSDPVERRAPIESQDPSSVQGSINLPAEELQRTVRSAPSKVRLTGVQVVGRPNLKVPPGTFAKAKFLTGASNGLVKAILVDGVEINGERVIESGAVLLGQGSSTEDRLMIQFTKMVPKNGSSQGISAQGCDLDDQTVGVRGEKLNKYAAMLAAGAGLNFLGGVAQGMQEQQVQNGVVTKKSDLKNAALNGASTAALEQGKEILNEWKQKKTVIQVKAGQEFYVLFEGE